MAQQFQADAQVLAANTNIPTTTETNGPSTNPLPVPYQNGKAKVRASIQITLGTGTTGLQVRLRRNINGENVVINTVNTFTAGAGNTAQLDVSAVDAIPDGRSVQYTVTVQQVAATANGTLLQGTYIEAVLLSG